MATFWLIGKRGKNALHVCRTEKIIQLPLPLDRIFGLKGNTENFALHNASCNRMDLHFQRYHRRMGRGR